MLEKGFTYNETHTSEMDVILVQTSNGMIEGTFGTNQTIMEDKVGDKIYYYGTEKSPLEFTVSIALDSNKRSRNKIEFSLEKRKQLVEWLFPTDEQYKPLVFDEYPNIVYYCKPVGEVKLFENYQKLGYITLKFRCNTWHGYYYPIDMPIRNFDGSNTDFVIENFTNVMKNIYPEITVIFKSNSKFELTNFDNKGEANKFTLDTMAENTIVTIDMKRKIIIDGQGNMLRSKSNGKWVALSKGINNLRVNSDFKGIVLFRVNYPVNI